MLCGLVVTTSIGLWGRIWSKRILFGLLSYSGDRIEYRTLRENLWTRLCVLFVFFFMRTLSKYRTLRENLSHLLSYFDVCDSVVYRTLRRI
jgi:hypothetical protein